MKKSPGTLVALGVLALAIAAAGTSWWFRYNATHKAVQFWGPSAAQLIRDAAVVELCHYAGDGKLSDCRDVSNAPGLTHLRYALLEDGSFKWPARTDMQSPRWHWALRFGDEAKDGIQVVVFTEDCRETAALEEKSGSVISCEPISNGLREVFGEMSAKSHYSRQHR